MSASRRRSAVREARSSPNRAAHATAMRQYKRTTRRVRCRGLRTDETICNVRRCKHATRADETGAETHDAH
jgi:hypothetical protein